MSDRDIVDTEPSTGSIWKMLLGSIDPAFDADPVETERPSVDSRYSGAT